MSRPLLRVACPAGHMLAYMRLAKPYRVFAGKELVLSVAGWVGGSRERAEDSVHVEQK